MNEKERIIKILKKEKVDRPACICPGGMMNMITTGLMKEANVYWPNAHLNPELMAELAYSNYKYGYFENVGVPFCMTIEAEAMGATVTMGTECFEPHVSNCAIPSVLNYENVKSINVNEGRAKVVIDAIKILKQKNLTVPIIGNITGPISTASSVADAVKFYTDLRKHNAEAHKFLEIVTNNLIIFANAMISAGADIITIADPSGTGEIMGPKLFDEFVVKYINDLISHIRKENIYIIVHICGKMNGVYKEVDRINADALSFDSVVSLKEAKKNLPNRVLMGNVSTYTLEFGSVDSVKSITKSCLSSGSQIIAPACGLGTKSPIENIKMMVDTVKEESKWLY